MVVTPPAAAPAVARPNPSAGSLKQCTWASTAPGNTSRPRASITVGLPLVAPSAASSAGRPSSTAAMRPCRTTSLPLGMTLDGVTRSPTTTRASGCCPLALTRSRRRPPRQHSGVGRWRRSPWHLQDRLTGTCPRRWPALSLAGICRRRWCRGPGPAEKAGWR